MTMIPTVDYTQQFVDFFTENFPSKQIPSMPKSRKDLTIELDMVMRDQAPYLYENLFKPNVDELPADVKLRHQKGMRWAQDVDVLEEAGFTGTVKNMRKEMAQAEQIMMAKKIEESQAIQKEQEQQRKAWEQLPLGHPSKRPSEASIARTKAQWGISE